MKKIIILTFGIVFVLGLQAQKPNPAMAKLFTVFANIGIESTYSADNSGQEYYLSLYTAQKADMHNIIQYNKLGAADYPFQLNGIREYINSQFKECEEAQRYESMIKPVIKHVLDSLAPLSNECYHYEVHNGVEDTIKYVLAMSNMPENLFQNRVKGRVDTKSSDEFIDYFSYNRGTFLNYHLPALQKKDKVSPYPTDSLKYNIEKILAKYKGKEYVVDYDINTNPDLYPGDWYIVHGGNKHFSKSYGTHFYFPLTRESQNAIIVEMAKEITDYVTSKNDTSEYKFFYTMPLEKIGRNSTIYDHLVFYNGGKEHISINMRMTGNGLHVLLLSNEGEWIVPRQTWWKI